MAQKILVVGPSPSLDELVTASVDTSRYQIERRADAGHAMEYLFKHSAVAIVVNIDHERDETMKFINSVRLQRRHRSAHIIAISQEGDSDSVRESIRAGADDYMSQPVHRNELSSRIQWAASMSAIVRSR